MEHPKQKRTVSDVQSPAPSVKETRTNVSSKKKSKTNASDSSSDLALSTPSKVKNVKIKQTISTTTTIATTSAQVEEKSVISVAVKKTESRKQSQAIGEEKVSRKAPQVVLSDSEAEEFDLLLQESGEIDNGESLLSDSDDFDGASSPPKTVLKKTPKKPLSASLTSATANDVLDPSITVIETRTISTFQQFGIDEAHPLAIRGTARVQVKTGKVVINGFVLTPQSDPVEVFSENAHALYGIKSLESGSSIVVSTTGLSAKNGSTEAPESNSNGAPAECRILQFSEEIEKFAALPYKRPLLLCGARNTGKSTLARYVVNALLGRYEAVAFLESDVGQSEFTPPGLVSLTLVREPLLGPPHTHQQGSLCSFFVGANTSSAHPRLYAQSIMYCFDHYRQFFGGVNADTRVVPLVVNTQGWVTGLGLDLLQQTVQYIQPLVVELRNTAEALDFPGSIVLQASARRNTASTATHARNLAFASYFLPSMLLPLSDVGRLLVREKPAQLDRSKTWLHALFGELKEPLETFNGMLVALCCAPSLPFPPSCAASSSLSSVLPRLPDATICVGLAIIRAISDESFYLITPAIIDHVNVLVKGELGLPPSFYYTEGCPYLTPTSSLATVGGAKAMASRRNVRRKSGT